MIIEGLVSTRNADGRSNVAPQGPIVHGEFDALHFRPFPGSVTYENLKRTRCGVFHVVDDVLLLVQTALDLPHDPPAVETAAVIDGDVLLDCCRWYEFEIDSIHETGERPLMIGRCVHTGRRRYSLGFYRARHAVIEATIAATRLQFLPIADVRAELERCQTRVDKTGGPREQLALRLVRNYVEARTTAELTSPESL